ncbi:MAG: 30S ribosomal protein S13 [Halobacteria archaeon]
MASEAGAASKADFRHIVRLVETDLDGRKTVAYALRGVKGIGTRTAHVVAAMANVDPGRRIGLLKDEEVERLGAAVEQLAQKSPPWLLNRPRDPATGENQMRVGTDWVVMVREDVEGMKRIRSYKGVRHEFGYKVRGQRTRSTGRGGAVVGVVRTKELAKLKAAKTAEGGKGAAAAAPAAAEAKKEEKKP